MRPDDVTRIRHMIEAAEAAARFLAGKTRENLDSDEVICLHLCAQLKSSAKRHPE
jgi:hypothetical protein